MASLPDVSVVKQGWLLKRGEYIKNWRPRWFQLKSDGSFRGFKTGPPAPGDSPMNFFDVAGSAMILMEDKTSKNRKYGFMIRFMQLTRIVERVFHCDTEEERAEWVKAYTDVKKKVMAQSSVGDDPRLLGEVTPGSGDGDREISPSSGGAAGSKGVSLDDYEMLKVLGRGTFGKVMLAREKATKKLYAVKILRKDVILQKDEVTHTLTENAVLQSTNHPFLTGLKSSFQTKDYLCFVMEYVNGGELFSHLRKSKYFGEDRARFYAAEIGMALSYLHEQGVVYRDLKLENLLLDKDGHVKITDFGLSKEEMSYGATTTTFCGTPEYLAPEVLEETEYGRAVDWWGLGIVLYEMISGKLPFTAPPNDWDRLFQNILTAPLKFPTVGDKPMSDVAKDLLTKLIERDPKKRLGGGPGDGQEVMQHPFFAGIDWKKLARREVPPPFVPVVKSDTDVSNFDTFFTKEEARLTPPSGAGALGTEERDESFESFESVAKH